jgi:hypothetical protein
MFSVNAVPVRSLVPARGAAHWAAKVEDAGNTAAVYAVLPLGGLPGKSAPPSPLQPASTLNATGNNARVANPIETESPCSN